jgi:hypothetical protein
LATNIKKGTPVVFIDEPQGDRKNIKNIEAQK